VRGVAGQDPVAGTCRWVGGLGHELGHAVGLPHPAGCDSGSPDCPASALMWLGYTSYPSATFIDAERTQVASSRFFSTVTRTTTTLFDCATGIVPPGARFATVSLRGWGRFAGGGKDCSPARASRAIFVPHSHFHIGKPSPGVSRSTTQPPERERHGHA
jgi:hypothetical protein